MASIPALLDGHITVEVECLERLYLNGYIGKLATGWGLVMFMREQLHKPVPSHIPIYEFRHKEDKDEIANAFRPTSVESPALHFRPAIRTQTDVGSTGGGFSVASACEGHASQDRALPYSARIPWN